MGRPLPRPLLVAEPIKRSFFLWSLLLPFPRPLLYNGSVDVSVLVHDVLALNYQIVKRTNVLQKTIVFIKYGSSEHVAHV